MGRTATTNAPVGEMMREWRGVRGMSQLDLGLAAGVSTRHICFIETGRSRPSRTMVLRLAETLELPLHERNTMLFCAGFAPQFPERDLQHEDLAPIRRALDLILKSHEPFPAFVLDRNWNILRANSAHRRLLSMLLPNVTANKRINAVRLVLDLDMLRPMIGNWELVAHVLGHRIHRQLRMPALADHERQTFEDILGLPDVRDAMKDVNPPLDAAVVIPLEIDLHGKRLSWFSTIATIGTPQDVTLDEMRIESLFPADEETERIVRSFDAGVCPPLRGR